VLAKCFGAQRSYLHAREALPGAPLIAMTDGNTADKNTAGYQY
jgi:hypothetical protein